MRNDRGKWKGDTNDFALQLTISVLSICTIDPLSDATKPKKETESINE
jgi:hypothetical protein